MVFGRPEAMELEPGGGVSSVLVGDVLFFPHQFGDDSNCEPTEAGNVQLAEYVAANPSEIVLGWVHSHPGHACFLSGPDVHTQWRWQSGVPECVAVVLSPADPTGTG